MRRVSMRQVIRVPVVFASAIWRPWTGNQSALKNDNPLPTHCQAWDTDSSHTTRPPQNTVFVETSNIKHEGELIMEDYGGPEEMIVDEITGRKDADNTPCEEPFFHQIKLELPEETPFKTVYCKDSGVMVKQEFNDETNTHANSNEIVSQILEELPAKDNIPFSKTLDSSATTSTNVKRPKQNNDFLQCDICYEYLLNHAALKIHYETKHEGDKETNLLSVPDYLVSSQGSNPPIKPPGESLSTDSCDYLENIIVSLRNIPLRKRNASKDKIIDLVNFIAKDDNLDPATIKFFTQNC